MKEGKAVQCFPRAPGSTRPAMVHNNEIVMQTIDRSLVASQFFLESKKASLHFFFLFFPQTCNHFFHDLGIELDVFIFLEF